MADKLAMSVIIPTHNRKDVLLETLKALEHQSLSADKFEVLVIDDGSSDGTCGVISRQRMAFQIRIYRQDSRGAAAARNLGALEACGEIILFLDADMIASTDLLVSHLEKHQACDRLLVVGRREEFDGTNDLSFSFSKVESEGDPRFHKDHFTFQEAFTCNLSIKSSHWMSLDGFDGGFPPGTGYEDTDFAYRAIKAGLEIFPAPGAVAFHKHPMSLKQRYQRARHYQRSAALLFKKHPELKGQIKHLKDKEPVNWKRDSKDLILRKSIRRLLALKPFLSGMEFFFGAAQYAFPSHRLLKFIYWKIVGSYQLIGFREGVKEYGW